tara:strand:- start:1456 stop:1764 length:309 start_codon:yes stop_codon:yes gene_type:complete
MSKNPFGKSISIPNFNMGKEKPYAIYKAMSGDLGEITIAVLKTYKKPDNCKADPNSRWFTAGKSAATYGSWEFGDEQKDEILKYFHLVECTPEWREAYHASR